MSAERETAAGWVARDPAVPVATIDVSGEGIYRHKIGDGHCHEGWCLDGDAGNGWPYPCKCGGLVHADFGDEDAKSNYWIYRKCDRCGDGWELADKMAQRLAGTDTLERPSEARDTAERQAGAAAESEGAGDG